MSKILVTGFALLSVLLFANASRNEASQSKQPALETPTGTLQKMIVENASITMQLDLNGLNGSNSLVTRPVTLHFAAAPNSFFPVLVFNDLLRGLQPGSMPLSLQNGSSAQATSPATAICLPHYVCLLSGWPWKNFPPVRASILQFEIATRDSRFSILKDTSTTMMPQPGRLPSPEAGFPYQNSLPIHSVSHQKQARWQEQFPSVRRCNRSRSIRLLGVKRSQWRCHRCNMQLVQQFQILYPARMLLLETSRTWHNLMPPVGTQVGLAIGTDSCNNGDQPINWFALPDNDHPLVPQNLYRMSGGVNNDARFEQIGQSWMKHTFLALEDFVCGNCNTSGCQTRLPSLSGLFRPVCVGPEWRPEQHRLTRLGQPIHWKFPFGQYSQRPQWSCPQRCIAPDPG